VKKDLSDRPSRSCISRRSVKKHYTAERFSAREMAQVKVLTAWLQPREEISRATSAGELAGLYFITRRKGAVDFSSGASLGLEELLACPARLLNLRSGLRSRRRPREISIAQNFTAPSPEFNTESESRLLLPEARSLLVSFFPRGCISRYIQCVTHRRGYRIALSNRPIVFQFSVRFARSCRDRVRLEGKRGARESFCWWPRGEPP